MTWNLLKGTLNQTHKNNWIFFKVPLICPLCFVMCHFSTNYVDAVLLHKSYLNLPVCMIFMSSWLNLDYICIEIPKVLKKNSWICKFHGKSCPCHSWKSDTSRKMYCSNWCNSYQWKKYINIDVKSDHWLLCL